MKHSAAEQLRARWHAQGNPPCAHPDIEQEREDQRGWATGAYVCTTCGAEVDLAQRCPKGGARVLTP